MDQLNVDDRPCSAMLANTNSKSIGPRLAAHLTGQELICRLASGIADIYSFLPVLHMGMIGHV